MAQTKTQTLVWKHHQDLTRENSEHGRPKRTDKQGKQRKGETKVKENVRAEKILEKRLGEAGTRVSENIPSSTARAQASAWWEEWSQKAVCNMREAVQTGRVRCILSNLMEDQKETLGRAFENEAVDKMKKAALVTWPREEKISPGAIMPNAREALYECIEIWIKQKLGPRGLDRARARLHEAAAREKEVKGRKWFGSIATIETLGEIEESVWKRVLREPPWAVREALRIATTSGTREIGKEGNEWKIALARRKAKRKHIAGQANGNDVALWFEAWPWREHTPPFEAIWTWASEGIKPQDASDALWAAGAQVRKRMGRTPVQNDEEDTRHTHEWIERMEETAAHSIQTLRRTTIAQRKRAVMQWARKTVQDEGKNTTGNTQDRKGNRKHRTEVASRSKTRHMDEIGERRDRVERTIRMRSTPTSAPSMGSASCPPSGSNHNGPMGGNGKNEARRHRKLETTKRRGRGQGRRSNTEMGANTCGKKR